MLISALPNGLMVRVGSISTRRTRINFKLEIRNRCFLANEIQVLQDGETKVGNIVGSALNLF